MIDKKEQLAGYELIADKGYLSLGYQTSLFEQDKIRLITPIRGNMKERIRRALVNVKEKNLI
ncbi:transposase [Lacihabitans soyangensis]|nr:transposase [Lacihabitans soyangensis]